MGFFFGLLEVVFGFIGVAFFFNFTKYVDEQLNILKKNQQRLEQCLERLQHTQMELSMTLAYFKDEMRIKSEEVQSTQLELARHISTVSSKVNVMDSGSQELQRRLEKCQNELALIPKQIVNNGTVISCNEYKPTSWNFNFSLFGK